MSNVSRYPKQVFWSDEDEGYIAVAPDLPGSSAFGESEQAALAELDDAIEAWIEAAQAAGNEVPVPSKPAMEDRYSGRVLLRLPKSLHRELAKAADCDGVSLNQHMVTALRQSCNTAAFQKVIAATISDALAAVDRSQRSFGSIGRWSVGAISPLHFTPIGENEPESFGIIEQHAFKVLDNPLEFPLLIPDR